MNGMFATRPLGRLRGSLGFLLLFGVGCTASVGDPPGGNPTGVGSSGTTSTASGTGTAGAGGSDSTGTSTSTGTGGSGHPIVTPAAEGARLRLLTQAEYITTMTALLGTIKGDLKLQPDTSVRRGLRGGGRIGNHRQRARC